MNLSSSNNVNSATATTTTMAYANAIAESLRHSRDRLAIEEQETELRLDVVKSHRRQFEQILTIHLERIMMSASSQKTSLFELLTGAPSATSSSSITQHRRQGKASSSSPPRKTSPANATTSFSSSPTACKDINNLPSARRTYQEDEESGDDENDENKYQQQQRHQDPNKIICKRLFAGASAKSLGRMSKVIPMKIPNTNDVKRRHACFRKIRQDIAQEQDHLNEFEEAEERRRIAYEKSREQLFRKTEEKSLKDRLRHDLAMKRRPPEIGVEKAIASDTKLMQVEERKRSKHVALQALSDTRRQIWIRTHQEVEWAKQNCLEQQREIQSRANKTVLASQDQRRRTESDLNDISIIANIHRRSHRTEAAARRQTIAAEQSRLLNMSRAITERNFESTGITVETSWEEEKSPMPATDRGGLPGHHGNGKTKRVAEISDNMYDRLCGTPRAPLPKFAGAADALKHMSSTAWDAMSELQHDSRLRALEFARFHSAGKMPPVSWK